MFFGRLKKWVLRLISFTTFVVSVSVILLLIYRFGYPQTVETISIIAKTFDALFVVQWFSVTLRLILSGGATNKGAQTVRMLIYVLFTVVTIALLSLHFNFLASDNFLMMLTSQWAIVILSLLIAIIELSRTITGFLGRKTNPAMLIAISFATVIFFGSLLLGLPNCSFRELSYIDSLFVSASAVCVTGLTPIDVATVLTPVGQVVLLLLIQIGGLGIMTITSFFGLFFVSGSFSNQLVVRDLLSSDNMTGLLRYALRIVVVTFVVEGLGALLIYFSMLNHSSMGHSEAIFFSIFHAVSAFCNAGFSTLSGNLYDPAVREITSVIWIISWLVIFGGIGFPIFNNLLQTLGFKIRNFVRRLFGLRKIVQKHLWQLNSYIVIKTTMILLILGWGFFLAVEWNNTLGHHDFWDKLAQGFLMAVTPRTAGFSGVDVGAMLPASIFVTIILMWIGGAPQSTAGGIKVTTLYLAVRNVMSSSLHESIEVKGRQIPQTSIRRAFGVIMASLSVIGIAIIILSLLEPTMELSKLIFEVFSAIGTVGMSIGITPELGTGSKVVVILLMFVGRVGIMSILMSFVKRSNKPKLYSLPEENILIN